MKLSHAILDDYSRYQKALKIERLTNSVFPLKRQMMLEVGCGSGFIASFFSKSGYHLAGTYAVDVTDERQIREGFHFKRVDSTSLPFKDQNFDFIISNHVIEHVGNLANQRDHLKEIFRCLEPGGVLYLAVPNRWRLIEPHYCLPFLSWLPMGLASRYVKLLGKNSHYDCRPLSSTAALELLRNGGFEVHDVTLAAIAATGQIEGNLVMRCMTKAPIWLWRPIKPIIPTLIYVCRKPC